MNKLEMKNLMLEILRCWTTRQIGNTSVMLSGPSDDTIVIYLDLENAIHNHVIANQLGSWVIRRNYVSMNNATKSLLGHKGPVLVDHAVLVRLIENFGQEAFERGTMGL